MKKNHFLYLMAIALLACTFTACSSDDGGDGGSEGSSSSVTINVGGQKATLGYVYWNIDDEYSTAGKHYYQMEFFSYDFYHTSKIPGTISMFYLGFYATGSESELPTGTFTDYDLSGGLGVSQSNPEGTYIEGDQNKSGNLVITKEGNTYTVKIEPLYIISGEESNTTTTLVPFNYTGSISKAPRKSWE